ncbi:hypothetical protein ACFVHS_25050 [Streptomyces sp. NPDC057746]|uniref:hypothetical protein n=1 Tax=Streptomyces sp. NPDC057746 TaxID=3346237 RepID=UPI0036777587
MSRKRARIVGADHRAIADAAKATPGVWLLACVYPVLESGRAAARRIRNGRQSAYEPGGAFEAYAARHDDGTAVWLRFVDGLDDVQPMPDVLTVRVPDYLPGPGYEGVHIATVDISARCQRCGGPRGRLRRHHFRKDDRHLVCDRWDNCCGHKDMYPDVLAEARTLAQVRTTPTEKLPEIRGVEGGQFFDAVNLIAEAVKDKRAMRATAAAQLLDDHGQHAAADVIRNHVRTSVTGAHITAKEVAYLLVQIDTAALNSGDWVDGRITYEATDGRFPS